MAHYQNLKCAARDMDDQTGVCGVEMRALGERHPGFGPNYRPGGWVFQCPRCEAVRYIDGDKLDRYAERR